MIVMYRLFCKSTFEQNFSFPLFTHQSIEKLTSESFGNVLLKYTKRLPEFEKASIFCISSIKLKFSFFVIALNHLNWHTLIQFGQLKQKIV